MDRKIIEERKLVERWVSKQLTPPEERYFEALIRKEPALVEALGLPSVLKRLMQLLDDTQTEWREPRLAFWQTLPVFMGAFALAGVFLIMTIFLYGSREEMRHQMQSVQSAAEVGFLNEPLNTQTIPVQVVRPATGSANSYSLGSRKSPIFSILKIDVHEYQGTLYSASLQRDDGVFVMRIDNVLRDSNGELHWVINSSVLAAGIYDLQLRESNLHGEGSLIGVAKLVVSNTAKPLG